MTFTEQIAAMETEVATLRSLWTQVAASQPLIDVSGGGASAAAQGFLKTMQQSIATLDADRVRVFSKLRSFESWWSEAQTYETAMRSQLGEAANYSLSGALEFTTEETATEIANKAPTFAIAGFGAVVLLLVLILAVKLA